jgi:hypothetical protein
MPNCSGCGCVITGEGLAEVSRSGNHVTINVPDLIGGPTDEAVYDAVTTDGSDTHTALEATYEHKSGRRILASDYATIQEAVDAAPAGATIVMDFPLGVKVITAKVTVTKQLRWEGTGRDYATQIQCSTGGVTMVEVKATGFVLDNVMLVGNGGVNGVGATVNGLDLFGDTDGNVDCTIGGNIIGCAVAARVRGRNSRFLGTSVTSSLKGIVLQGKDGAYHTGPNADENRGHVIEGCRFHNIGTASSDAAVEITTTSKMQHLVLRGNFFDSDGLGRPIVATGTSGDPIRGLHVHGNTFTEVGADVFDLTYVQNSSIEGVGIRAYVGVGATYGRGFVLTNCTDLDISNVYGLQLGQHGAFGTGNTRIRFDNVKFRALGGDPSGTADGFNFDSSNSGIIVNPNCTVNTTDGYGFNGSPTASACTARFEGCALGRFNSTTLGDETVMIPASQFAIVTGTPAYPVGFQGVGHPPVMAFDAASIEQVNFMVPQVPQHWLTYDVQIVWIPTTTLGGNVKWDLGMVDIVIGAVPSSPSLTTVTVAAGSTTGLPIATTILAGVARTPHLRSGRFYRDGTNAADTYAADAQVLAVQLLRTA